MKVRTGFIAQFPAESLLIIVTLTTSTCLADSPSIYDSQNGKYLGKLGVASTMPIQQTTLTDAMAASTVLTLSIIHTDNMGANIVMTHQPIPR